MGAVPKHKITSKRKGKRRSQIKLSKQDLVICKQCQKPKKHHHECPHCGAY